MPTLNIGTAVRWTVKDITVTGYITALHNYQTAGFDYTIYVPRHDHEFSVLDTDVTELPQK